jgi:hypothetical protein
MSPIMLRTLVSFFAGLSPPEASLKTIIFHSHALPRGVCSPFNFRHLFKFIRKWARINMLQDRSLCHVFSFAYLLVAVYQ